MTIPGRELIIAGKENAGKEVFAETRNAGKQVEGRLKIKKILRVRGKIILVIRQRRNYAKDSGLFFLSVFSPARPNAQRQFGRSGRRPLWISSQFM
jgi:hypothetical protein